MQTIELKNKRQYVKWPVGSDQKQRNSYITKAGREFWKTLSTQERWAMRFYMLDGDQEGYFGLKPDVTSLMDGEWDFGTPFAREMIQKIDSISDSELVGCLREFPGNYEFISEALARLLVK